MISPLSHHKPLHPPYDKKLKPLQTTRNVYTSLLSTLLLISSLGTIDTAHAMGWFQTSEAPAKKVSAPTSTKNAEPEQITYHYCPIASTLFKEGLIWKAPGGWRSHSDSFVEKIAGFVGTQWIGIRVGKVICLYRGAADNTFPVSIERDNLAKTPKGGRWGDNQGGYKNCRSSNIKDCGFILSKTPQIKTQDIYKTLDAFK